MLLFFISESRSSFVVYKQDTVESRLSGLNGNWDGPDDRKKLYQI